MTRQHSRPVIHAHRLTPTTKDGPSWFNRRRIVNHFGNINVIYSDFVGLSGWMTRLPCRVGAFLGEDAVDGGDRRVFALVLA